MIGFTSYAFRAEAVGTARAMVGARVVMLKYDPRGFYLKYKIKSFAVPYWDSHMLSRMLAKIGHSFAAAELGLDKFRPLLPDLIRKGAVAPASLIGGDMHWSQPSKALHEIGLGYQRNKGTTYVVAKIRLFARHGGPTYYAVVGESLETPIARFRRAFSNRISSILVRWKSRLGSLGCSYESRFRGSMRSIFK